METIKPYYIKRQIMECKAIIKAIDNGKYHDASIRIRFNLDNNNYCWYKDVKYIIDNQITNLFYDIETNFKDDLTRNFFKRTIQKLTNILNTGVGSSETNL